MQQKCTVNNSKYRVHDAIPVIILKLFSVAAIPVNSILVLPPSFYIQKNLSDMYMRIVDFSSSSPKIDACLLCALTWFEIA